MVGAVTEVSRVEPRTAHSRDDRSHCLYKEALLNSPEGKNAGLVQMSATYRIGNRNKIDKDKFIEIINKVFNSPKLTVYSPKEGSNTSSKYNMFEFELKGEGLVQLYLAGGANEGEKYEQDLLQKMK